MSLLSAPISLLSAALADYRAAHAALLDAADRVRVLAEAEAGQGTGPAEVALIQRVVARRHGFAPASLCSAGRQAPVVAARHAAMWICRELTPCGLATIGAAFGGRDHGTVMWACARTAARLSIDGRYSARLLALREECARALDDFSAHTQTWHRLSLAAPPASRKPRVSVCADPSAIQNRESKIETP